jgi:phytoene synthase
LPDAATRADLAACRRLLRGGSKSFHAAAFLLPWRVREPAIALYAFCRVADDAIDLGSDRGVAGTAAALAHLRERLAAIYAGQPQAFAVDRALADVVSRFALPRALPEALLEGFAWDAQARQYETLEDLVSYAARVAGAVGVMLALIMGVGTAAAIARAIDLGIAMQLSNIARDVGEDARAGRLYLPRRWLREQGVDPEAWLARPEFTPALGAVVARLLAAADGFYARAEPGIAALPPACRPGIRAAKALYAEIGRTVARKGGNPIASRAVVSPARKLWLLVGSFVPVIGIGRRWAARMAWLLDLFARLAERERLEREWRDYARRERAGNERACLRPSRQTA